MSRRQVAVLIIVVAVCIIAARHIHAATLNCQYPNRTTNTATQCDNSDPCDPSSAAKGGDGSCKGYNNTPDPNRPYYDAAGNEYDAAGTLIRPAKFTTAPEDNTPVIVNDAPGTGK